MQRRIQQLSVWPLAAGMFFVLAACLQAQTREVQPPPLYGPMGMETCETDPPGFLPFWENDPAVLTAKLLGGSPPSGVTITQTQLIGGGAAPDLGNGYYESFFLSDGQHTLTIPGLETGTQLVLWLP